MLMYLRSSFCRFSAECFRRVSSVYAVAAKDTATFLSPPGTSNAQETRLQQSNPGAEVDNCKIANKSLQEAAEVLAGLGIHSLPYALLFLRPTHLVLASACSSRPSLKQADLDNYPTPDLARHDSGEARLCGHDPRSLEVHSVPLDL